MQSRFRLFELIELEKTEICRDDQFVFYYDAVIVAITRYGPYWTYKLVIFDDFIDSEYERTFKVNSKGHQVGIKCPLLKHRLKKKKERIIFDDYDLLTHESELLRKRVLNKLKHN